MFKSFYRRLLLYLIDIFVVSFSLLITIKIFNGFDPLEIIFENFARLFFLNIFISSLIYKFTGQYKGLTRYVGSISFYHIILRNLLISYLLFIFPKNDSLTLKFIFLYWLVSAAFVGFSKVLMRDILIKCQERHL